MIKKTFILFFFLLSTLSFPCASAQAEYESIYHYYVEEGLDAFYSEQFDDAIFYFRTASAIDPSNPEPLRYINLIKRQQEGRLKNPDKTPILTKSQQPAFETPLPAHQDLISRTTEQAMYDILKASSVPFFVSDQHVQDAVDQAADFTKSDIEEKLSDQEWTQIHQHATANVLKRVERLRARNTDMSIATLPKSHNAVINEETLDPAKAKTSKMAEQTVVPVLEPISAVKMDLDQSPPIIVNHSPEEQTEPRFIEEKKKIGPKRPEVTTNFNAAAFNPTAPMAGQTQNAYTIVESSGSVRRFYDNEELRMTDDVWAQQQTLTLEIEIGKSVIFSGSHIKRYLSTLEEVFEITRINKDKIRVKAVKRGNTIFYIWDDKGRWKFNVHCVYPFENIQTAVRDSRQELVSPFQFGYTNSWSTLHKGPTLGDMTRQNIVFTNWMGVAGQTPYGDFDASINTYRFAQSTEIIGQRVGLNNGHIGPFNDFQIRGYDTFKSLSDLTLIGRNFRGIALDSYAFEHKLAYSYFRGQDQSISIYSNDGNVRKYESYVEGFKLTLNPDLESSQYSVNIARGYGTARLPNSKDHAYSIETVQKFNDFKMHGELGYDENEVASVIQGVRQQGDTTVAFNLRDINPGYQTIYGQPSNSGQAGASLNISTVQREFRWDTFMDLYRDRASPNVDNPDLVNLDFSTSYSRSVNDMSTWGVSLGYVNTAQSLSARQFLQTGATYSKNIKVGQLRYLSLSLVQTMQWSRYKDSPTSDYDRMGLRAGMRYKLLKYLFYSLSYEYSLVHDVYQSDWSTPSSLQTGFNFNTPLTERLSMDFDVTYRNESQASGNFSFLAGEDSLSNTISLTYRPMDRISIYMDSQLRHVWPMDTNLNPNYYDWNLMMGVRADWDLPFRWNPTGQIQGIVYKDYNGNSLQDRDEPGMPGIRVNAGKYQTVTNENGEYSIKASARKVTVGLDLKTIPKGFVFSTALTRDIKIEHKKAVRVNFGLTSRSGIYGVAFLDVNQNGRPDRGDQFVSNIVVRLDSGEITKTDYSGSYFFENVSPGRHIIKIDVTSIPIEYVPTVKIETEVMLEEGMTSVNNIPLKENPQTSKR